MGITLILLCAGSSTRFGIKTKKQWLRVGTKPLWLSVLNSFEKFEFENIIVVAKNDEIKYMQNFTTSKVVAGGETRQASLHNALGFVDTKHLMVSDVARACIPKSVIDRLLENKDKADVIVPYIKAQDSVVYENKTVDRDKIKLIQTPQLSNTIVLKKALLQEKLFTDDSSAIRSIGGSVVFVDGDKDSIKLTTKEDLKFLPYLEKAIIQQKIGHGYDVHKFNNTPPLMLGGVKIDVDYGFEAYSDGDVLIHALIDSLLGSVGAGDIGELFPDNDNTYKGIDSGILLEQVVEFLHKIGARISNVDITVIAQKPRLSKYKAQIRQNLCNILQIDLINVNVKATTTEKLGFVGRSEGVAVEAVASVIIGENI